MSVYQIVLYFKEKKNSDHVILKEALAKYANSKGSDQSFQSDHLGASNDYPQCVRSGPLLAKYKTRHFSQAEVHSFNPK